MRADAVADGVAKTAVSEARAELPAEEDALDDGDDTSLGRADKEDSAVNDDCADIDPVGLMETEFLELFEDDGEADEVSDADNAEVPDGCADAVCVYAAENDA